ncbi:hypothetical protein BROUX41_005015 [Berkeleyomyces rouxiae]|uniref:uncharacterized protein n=1 Tax=Berkeleyomyces rouxiae TaxID=2035830 RepID=UPI003B7988E9
MSNTTAGSAPLAASQPPPPPVPESSSSHHVPSNAPSITSSQQQTNREQIAQTLDKIHTTASQSAYLTTFTEIGSPRQSTPPPEEKAAENIPAGLSGLYSRFKGVVSGASSSRLTPNNQRSQDVDDADMVAAAAAMAQSPGLAPPALSAALAMEQSNPVQADSLTPGPRSSVGSRQSMFASNNAIPVDDSALGTLGTDPVSDPSRQTSGTGDVSVAEPLEDDPATPKNELDTTHSIKSPVESLAGDSRATPSLTVSAPVTSSKTQNLPAVISKANELNMAPASPVRTTARGSVYNNPPSRELRPQTVVTGVVAPRSSNSAASDAGTESTYPKLNSIEKRVLSKEFWMADETCKECYLCSSVFTAFRRKHHCRLCGLIFDSKCMATLPGEYFGVNGMLRVCKTCREFFQSRLDDSSDSEAETYLARFVGYRGDWAPSVPVPPLEADSSTSIRAADEEDYRPSSTPMMAIPGTRHGPDGAAVLEIELPQLSRAGSSKSLRALANPRMHTSGHKRHHSKHNLHGFSSTFSHHSLHSQTSTHSAVQVQRKDEKVPFRKPLFNKHKAKLSAFHDDNIIDPELQDFVSDDASSGDEQTNIASSSNQDFNSTSFENDKSTFGNFLTASRRHRLRPGDKSVSGLSFTSRALEENMSPSLYGTGSRQPRRRNLSIVSSAGHFMRSPRPKSGIFKFANITNEPVFVDSPIEGSGLDLAQLYPSDSALDYEPPKIQLSPIAENHFRQLLRQLLQDNDIDNIHQWEKALVPLIQRCTDEVAPDTYEADFMDIRHYVKIKKIAGAKPSNSAYTSGIVFSKNVALKSMSRKIIRPKILLLSFPLEYQRHSESHFCKIEPVIAQEREYLRIVVSKIIQTGPHLILSSKGVSGIALQTLSDADISVVYNVKQSVMEAVARCAEGTVIESLDMLALADVPMGFCGKFEVRTFVNSAFPGGKKSYVFLSDCMRDLGGTITLRGSNIGVMAKLKQIVEFLIYVMYNLKLESSMLKDSFVHIPDSLPTPSTAVAIKKDLKPLPSGPSSTGPSDNNGESASVPTADISTVNQTDPPTCSNPEANVPNSVIETSVEIPPIEKNKIQHAESVSHQETTSIPEQSDNPPAPTTGPTIDVTAPQEPASIETDRLVELANKDDHLDMPSYYSDIVVRFETKILSTTPFVKFTQPYLLQKARLLERRLNELRRLKEQYSVELNKEKTEDDGAEQRFQLVQPDMLHAIGHDVPKQILRIIHAAHEVEYDNFLHTYHTQRRLWEGVIQSNIDLCDPNEHQTLVVLQSTICTSTKIPCSEPSIVSMRFYIDRSPDPDMDNDGTLGQFLERLYREQATECPTSSCTKTMMDHHRTYVHDQRIVTVFTEPNPAAMQTEVIMMWSYCKRCKKDTPMAPMSEHTYRYSFCKYLEFLFWGHGLTMEKSLGCPHDFHQDHIRYFTIADLRVRLHLDPIDLLEIVVPRKRFTWKVEYDIQVKNDVYNKYRDVWLRFMASVVSRLKSIRIDSVLPEKAESCKEEIDRLLKKAQEDQKCLIKTLQDIYMDSKYYELIPFNRVSRRMMDLSEDWNFAFKQFEADFLPDKDMRQVTMLQLRKMFSEDDTSRDVLPINEAGIDIESPEAADDGDGNGTLGNSEETMANVLPEEKTGLEEETSAAPGSSTEAGDKSVPVDGDASATTADDDSSATPALGSSIGEALAIVAGVSTAILENGEEDSTKSRPPVTPTKSPRPVSKSLHSQESESERGPDSGQTAVPGSPQPRSPREHRPSQSQANPSSTHTATRSPTRMPTEGTDSELSLSERIEIIRKEHGRQQASDGSDSDARSRPGPRRAMSTAGAGLNRSSATQSLRTPPKALPGSRVTSKESKSASDRAASGSGSGAQESSQDIPQGKKFSERLGLKRNKAGSAIPRPLPKKTPKVSALAKHFEQLSREFERERIRDRKKREEKERLRQPRSMLPRTSAANIVVYDNVSAAVAEGEQEPEPEPPEVPEVKPELKSRRKLKRPPMFPKLTKDKGSNVGSVSLQRPVPAKKATTVRHESAKAPNKEESIPAITDLRPQSSRTRDTKTPEGIEKVEAKQVPSRTEPEVVSEPQTQADSQAEALEQLREETQDQEREPESQEPNQDSQQVPEQEPASAVDGGPKDVEGLGKISDDEGGSENEALIDDAQDVEPLPGYQKNSLLKMIANFWAERSSSGWAPLDFPITPMEHIFTDSDIVIREDEPSSLIAFALSSLDYRMKLAESRYNVHKHLHSDDITAEYFEKDPEFSGADPAYDQDLERELLSPTGSHVKFQFQAGSSKMHCKIFYAGHFDAMRRKCGLAERFIESLSRCIAWDSRGGKSKSVFLKTMDDRLVLKSLSAVETSAFLNFAPSYFGVMAEALFRDLPSVIAKMVGFFQIYIKNPATGVDLKLDLLVMENLFYDRAPTKKFDLKGSMRNRKVDPTGAQDEVLLDENMVDYIYESPLFAREHSKRLLRSSVYNDTLFLSKQNVMDYSLMVAIDEPRQELVVGIVDCIRTYTLDKKLETWIKDRSLVGGGRSRPTVTSPREYKNRFRAAMSRYILQAPDCWRLFNTHEPRLRPRFELDEV